LNLGESGIGGHHARFEASGRDGKASPWLDEASLRRSPSAGRRLSRLGGDGRYDTFSYDTDERLTTEHYQTPQQTTLFRFDYTYDDDGNRYRKEYRDDDSLRVYYSDATGATTDGEDTNLAPSNRVVRAWTKTGAGEKLMGDKLNVTGSYTETNLWSISIEANDSGSPVDATWRDGFWIARGVSLNDDDGNTLEATITDLGENSSTYPVSPATYPTKLDRNLNVAYEYDAAGNITKKTQVVDYDAGGSTTYITRYFYDDANRLEYIDYDWTTTEDVHYVYDPVGQRIAIEYGEIDLDGEDFDDFTPASARGFVCMGGNVLEEWTVSGGSLASLVYRYVRNPATNLGGGIGSIAYQIDGADYRYYHYNHKGDTGALTDEDAKIVAWYEYDAWGNVVTEWEASGVDNEFRFSTKQWDATPAGPPDAGPIYFGARYLSTELGRWTQLDPAGTVDGLNMYGYVRQNPLEYTGPYGEEGDATFVLCAGLFGVVCDAALGRIQKFKDPDFIDTRACRFRRVLICAVVGIPFCYSQAYGDNPPQDEDELKQRIDDYLNKAFDPSPSEGDCGDDTGVFDRVRDQSPAEQEARDTVRKVEDKVREVQEEVEDVVEEVEEGVEEGIRKLLGGGLRL